MGRQSGETGGGWVVRCRPGIDHQGLVRYYLSRLRRDSVGADF
jgi:hypothetical protein